MNSVRMLVEFLLSGFGTGGLGGLIGFGFSYVFVGGVLVWWISISLAVLCSFVGFYIYFDMVRSGGLYGEM